MSSASNPRPQWDDIQGLILSAYTHLKLATYLLFRIADVAQAKRWLEDLLDNDLVTSALKHKHRDHPSSVNVALSARGISLLAGEERRLDTSLPFFEGIAGNEHRLRMLGDTGKSSPEHWCWGGPHAVDVLLMVFADTEPQFHMALNRVRPSSLAMTLVKEVIARPLQENKREHFGFVDGISQPILVGTTDGERYPESVHLTALGEVVLGYPDGSGELSQGPSLSGCPYFGRNGSYLVARQLHQNVGAFWSFMEGATCMGNVPSPAAEALASKVIGRRMDGTPLVPYSSSRDNEFGFGEDPYGYGCPAGAHIRRGNPRDMFPNQPSTPIEANRHRILRRGRSYGSTVHAEDRMRADDTKPRGLMFIALNSDLEQQFEFIQQNWVNNLAFAGLQHERDPLIGDRSEHVRFTIAGAPAPMQVADLPQFVRTVGGEYFFLPGLNALRFLVDA